MRESALTAVDEALRSGASYADVRAVTSDHESITVQDQTLRGAERSTSRGVGVRALADGAWGFAATTRLDPEAVAAAARHAVEVARASASLRREPIRLAPVQPVVDRWVTPHERDPFEVPLEEKLSLLFAATEQATSVDGLAFAEGATDAWRNHTWLVTSEGTDIEQTILQVGAGVEATAVGERETQTRSFPNSARGYCGTGGWEDVLALDLPSRAAPHAEEAVALLSAPELPATSGTLVVGGSQLALQVHESVGHPLELDRILGYEADFAGASFVSTTDVGRLRYGSSHVSLTLDTTTPGALGTYGYDDEGVPAGRHPLVVDGVLTGLLSSRETAPAMGPTAVSNGTMRADSWASIPLIRMSNVHLEPGESSFEELLSDTGEGVLVDTNSSWSIDDQRVNFQFGCEIAWEIRRGKLGRRLRNPTYTGRTTDFWGSCDAVAGPETWSVYGTPNCGKGQPLQGARVAHGAAPARFRGVEMGVLR